LAEAYTAISNWPSLRTYLLAALAEASVDLASASGK
jgi:hypothetical protein